MNSPLISYAQNKEDIILRALLKDVKKGFYVDVGANHPVHESVTKLFYDQGWSGINVEPAERLHKLLELTRPRDINPQVGISDKEGELMFREYLLGDGLSTFSIDTQEAYRENEHYKYFAKDYVDHTVPVTTLSKLLAEHAGNKAIDFMKIDVEGYEYEAVLGNDWQKYRPTILCIEANHIFKDWHPIIEKANYKLVFWDGLNEYFVAKEKEGSVKDFSYADSVFLGLPFISWTEYNTRRKEQTEANLLRLKLEESQNRVRELESQAPPSRFANSSSVLKHGMHKVDRKIIHVLGPDSHRVRPTDGGAEPSDVKQLTVLLKKQFKETLPSSSAHKRLAGKGYNTGKHKIVKFARRRRD